MKTSRGNIDAESGYERAHIVKDASAFARTSSVALLGVGMLVAGIALADTFEVDTTVDLPDDGLGTTMCHTSAGTCSLRAAIMKSNQIGGSNIIHVPDGVYLLTIPPSGLDEDDIGDLNVTASVAITGQGAGHTIIDANQLDRAFDVDPGQVVALSDIAIRNGRQTVGGGIRNDGILTITHSVVEGNLANWGGGILNMGSGVLTVIGSIIRSNNANSSGGGILSSSFTTIIDSTLYGNGALGSGGGIEVQDEFSPLLYVVNSTISGNYANTNGGGIDSIGDASTFIYNTTVVGNDADHDHDENGGIGGGVYAGAGTRFVVVNALIAGNTFSGASFPDNCSGALEAYGMNLLDEREGCTTTTSDSNLGFVSLSTIGPLQDNGGPTPTHALLTNSEAIDNTIDSLGCVDETGSQLTTEQRGASRVTGARCDVGAFEFGSVVDNIFADGFD